MIRFSQLVLVVCLLTQTALAQFVLDISGTSSGTEVTAVFSGADLSISGNGKSRWGNNNSTALVTYTFSNGTGTTLGGTSFSGLSGTIKLWGNKNDKIGRVVLTINDSAFKGETLTNLTFTAASSDIQFDALSNYISDSITRNQSIPSGTSTSLTISAIPEPATYAVMLGATALLWYHMKRKKRRKGDKNPQLETT